MTYSEIFNRAWDKMKNNLAFIAGLSFVMMIGIWVLSLIPILGYFLTGIISTGYLRCLYLLGQGKIIGYKDFFWGISDLNRAIQILIMNFIISGIAIIAFCLLVIPGIWWTVASWLSATIFVTKNEDAVAAVKSSLRIAKDRWWFLFGLGCLVALLNLGGALCLFFGLLVTMPMTVYICIELVERLYSPLSTPVGETQMDIAATTSPEPPPLA